MQLASNFVARVLKSDLSRNSIWMFLGYGSKIVIQAGYFVLIARTLGAANYGAFVGAAALAGIASPFCGLGAGNLLIKNVSRDRGRFSTSWGNALMLMSVTGTVLLALIMLIGRLILPASIPWALIVMVSIADIFGMRFVDLAGQAFQAVDQLKHTAQLLLMPNVLRLFGALFAFLEWHKVSASTWAWFYLGSTTISAIGVVFFATWKLGRPTVSVGNMRKDLVEGLYFSVGLSAQTIYNDIDKSMLAGLSTLESTGIYAAAYRLIDVAFSPPRSVLYAAHSNFFRHGKCGIENSYAYGLKLLRQMTPYSLAIFFGLLIGAPLVPLAIGREYLHAVEALRWLALLPLIKTIHYLLGDSLTGAGHQGGRTAAQIAIAFVNVGLNLWLIPRYSWRGAAWASLASDGLLAVCFYLLVLSFRRRVKRADPLESETQGLAV